MQIIIQNPVYILINNNNIYLSVQFQYLTFQPNPKVSDVCEVKVFASMLVLACAPGVKMKFLRCGKMYKSKMYYTI